MARLVSALAALVAVAVGGYAPAVEGIKVPSHTITQLDHSARVFKLTSSHGPNVQFKILSLPKSSRGSPNEGLPAGHISSASGWRTRTAGPTKWTHASKQLYVDNKEMKYNAQAMLKKDIYPKYGDRAGEWLVQHGQHNWVTFAVPSLHEISSIDIFETFNPGGVVEVELLSKHSNRKVVYTKGWNNAVNIGSASGANKLRISVKNVPFEVSFVRITVDASDKWRGLDYFEITGSERMDTKMPGTLASSVVTYSPSGKKAYGCDEFKYAANAGRGWSAPGTIKVCFEAPRHNGLLCSNRGRVDCAKCRCPAGWGGGACEVALCPMHGGRMCNGVGSCNAGTCKCPGGYFGKACHQQGVSKYCYACNDPHYRSFWGRRFDLYSTGEWVLHYWPGGGGQKVLQIDHYVWRLYVDGTSIRYGNDIATWKWRSTHAGSGGLLAINCRRVGSGWHHTRSGMRVYLAGNQFRAHIGNWMSFWMSTGCFGLTTLTGGPAHGMCNDKGWWHVPGSCRLYTCNRCGANQLLSLMSKSTEKITPVVGGRSSSSSSSGYPLKFSHKLSDHIIPIGDDAPTMPESIAALGDGAAAARTATFVADDDGDDIRAKAHRGGVVAKKLRGARPLAGERGGHLASHEKYIVNMMSVYGMEADEQGKVDQAKLNAAIKQCDPAILRRVMHLDRCLKFIGSEEFTDCVMDACLLAKNLNLNAEDAAKEAQKENDVANAARIKELDEVDTLRKNEANDVKEARAAANEA